ncbi:Hpt domain-containing protein [Seleniivibrio sp.]|uniref:Hpt domain-containing protein n=1 Tax=Seleniivibrio sp. TaxID=2898801 RepID=UPI0025D33619|nr:Hpt domain-containing protein [Seleniivibrio sp.]MCD8552892.1 Hpt domain-containing protein [Seleniivibrio sp.]
MQEENPEPVGGFAGFSFGELQAQIGLAPDVLASLLREFCEDSEADLKKAVEELAAGNVRNSRDLLHSVRSAAGNMRLSFLSEKLKNADEFVKKNDTVYVKELIKEITDILIFIKNETIRRREHGT